MSDIFVQLIDKYCSELLDPKGGAPWYPRTQIMEEINKLRQYAAKTDQQSEIDALHDEIERLRADNATLRADAERYRVLRDSAEKIKARIDAALRGEKP